MHLETGFRAAGLCKPRLGQTGGTWEIGRMTADVDKAAFTSDGDETSPELNLQEALLDAICDSASSAFLICDKNDLLLHASRQILNFFPIPPRFLEPMTRLRDFWGAVFDAGVWPHEKGAKSAQPASRDDWVSQKIASHWRERFEATECHAGGRWIRFVKRRLPNGTGVCAISDISEEKKREQQWRADLERVQLTEDILDNLPFPVVVKDRDMIIVAVNKAFCDKYLTPPDLILGRKGSELFSADIASRYDRSDLHVLETGEMSIARQRQITPAGAERDIVTRKLRIGKPGRYFLVATTQYLPFDGEDFEEFSSPYGLVTSGDRSYKGTYIPTTAPRGAFNEPRAMETLSPELLAGRKILVVSADPASGSAALKVLEKYGLDACVVRDEHEQAVFLDVAGARGVRIDLVVVDNRVAAHGVSIAGRHNIPALRVDGEKSADGLIFLIARHFNRNMPSTALPSAEAEVPSREIHARTQSGQVEVLVVEDNEINQIVFSQILEGLGYSYLIASSGEAGVQMWNEYRPQLMLMDMSLPGMTGFEATQMIRRLEGDHHAPTPIIGVLTQAYEHDRDECAASGMDDVIIKPISPDMLDAAVRKYAARMQIRAGL